VTDTLFTRAFSTAALVTMLSGCGSDGMDDLRHFVQTAHAGKTAKVEPLPEIKQQETFSYGASGLIDPFAAFTRKAAAAAGSGPRPDMNRRKEALEEFPLDALRMVGTLTRGRQSWAVIQAPDGTIHRASVGHFMGHNFGKILRISEDKVSLIELVQGPSGDWVEREASVALAE
jgi:type IV pilus assembly protein PilP